MKLWWHKITHWEYWPVYIVYMPTFLLWVWWAIRFRTFRFYNYSNPAFKNGGLYNDSKMDIYKLLPDYIYPNTIFIKKDSPKKLEDIATQFQFPLIVKPDVGCRGVDVQHVKNIDELIAYQKRIKSDFLIQEIINYPNEIGLFYCRLPNQENGHITGITIKQFLTIKGNGKDSIEQLLNKNKRYALQIPTLRKLINLDEIVPQDVEKCLVPFGNHNRGTLFLCGKQRISKALEENFNKILNKIDGFYFGRLDIRFNTFEELEQGKNFSIIEINGAKSEPTHIYDPKYSFWYGQKEIFRHQMLMKNIIESIYSRGKTRNRFFYFYLNL